MTLHLASSFGQWSLRYLDIFAVGFCETRQVLQAITEASGLVQFVTMLATAVAQVLKGLPRTAGSLLAAGVK